MNDSKLSDDKPWWHYGHVWMVISGPAMVIVACVITFYFIYNSPNQIVSGQDIQIENIRESGVIDGSDAPAMMARNHAATGTIPAPKAPPEGDD